MECPPTRAQAWLDDHEGELGGLDVEDATALIESAGLHVRRLPRRGGWITQELRDDRINLWSGEAGAVHSVTAG